MGAYLQSLELGNVPGHDQSHLDFAEMCIRDRSITGVDVFAYACLSTSLVVADWQQRLQDKIACFSKVPAVSAFTAMISALYFIKAKKVSVLCPYGDELVNKVSDAFNAYDISAARIESLNVTGLRDVCNVSLPEIYRTARKIDMSDSDALCILATDLATLPLTTVLEQDLEKPVVSTNLALMWASLLLAGITPHISGAGQLMEMMKDVDAALSLIHIFKGSIIAVISLAFALFGIWSNSIGMIATMEKAGAFVGFTLALVFLLNPSKNKKLIYVDYLLALLGAVVCLLYTSRCV